MNKGRFEVLMYSLLMLTILLMGESQRSVLAQSAKSKPTNQAAKDGLISYEITPDPLADRTNIHVVMTFDGEESGETRINLPSCKYGTPRIWNSISNLKADGVSIRTVEGDPGARSLTHDPGRQINLQYTVSRGPTEDDGVAYRPSTDKSHFHFFGSQWRVGLGGREGEQSYQFTFANVPNEWVVFSNIGHGPGPYHVKTSEDELSGFIAGGSYHSAQFDVGGTPVGVYIQDAFADPKQVVNAAQAIITKQGEIFGGLKRDFFVVSITARPKITAGVAIDNAFVCLTRPDTTKSDMDVLIAHEFFHNWLPHTATISCLRSPTDIDEFRLDWFVEGFTEFVARRMLLDSGRLDMDQYVERFNRDLREQARNSMRRASLEVVRRSFRDGLYTNYHERTSYFRGPLIALSWDSQLRRQGKHTLIDMIQEFVKQAAKTGGTMDEEAFFELVESFGIDGRADYTKHIVYGDPPVPPHDIFGSDYGFEPTVYQQYEQGLDLHWSRRAGVVKGVVLDGPAYEAGLRDGMEFVKATRSRSTDDFVRVVVREQKGDQTVERVFEFLPLVIDVNSGQFVRTGK